uniref:NADH dehydrogenase subunit 4L n=1 Tax=Bipalium kewense TaxID=66750 RepID=A0A649UB82_9PLAT|nr:NADH dehydrogenase subunit 4L [Bipalium kewense]QGI24384.1 NADH dehydrogenase subunit 4L [Bipalium kewense]
MNILLENSIGVFFWWHLFILYFFSFRFLNFLISIEVILAITFLFFSFFSGLGEMSFLLVLLSLIACGVAVGLSVLVSWMRFFDKNVFALNSVSMLH